MKAWMDEYLLEGSIRAEIVATMTKHANNLKLHYVSHGLERRRHVYIRRTAVSMLDYLKQYKWLFCLPDKRNVGLI